MTVHHSVDEMANTGSCHLHVAVIVVVCSSSSSAFICPEQHKKHARCTIQCGTGHKGMKHLQVPETKPNNKNTKITK